MVAVALKKLLVLLACPAVGEVEKSDMMSALAVCGLAVEEVGARKSRSKILEPAMGAEVGAGGAAAAVTCG
jgi:hypothetical protein